MAIGPSGCFFGRDPSGVGFWCQRTPTGKVDIEVRSSALKATKTASERRHGRVDVALRGSFRDVMVCGDGAERLFIGRPSQKRVTLSRRKHGERMLDAPPTLIADGALDGVGAT